MFKPFNLVVLFLEIYPEKIIGNVRKFMNKEERHGKSLLVPESTFWEVYPVFSMWSHTLDHSLLSHSKF